ncbi:BTAD domain-containing putative transcriptional regulator [Nonomuraea sp. NPDC050540]|uniref:BTAD domain-containing putative transcriptional regulator n=1 Tax=Nonomuraea sp. NPDC050540 TaxID=3364367 RepID=UPI003787EFD6
MKTSSGESLRAERVKQRLSQRELASKAGVSVRTIRAIENGSVAHPHPETLRKLTAVLGENASVLSQTAELSIHILGPLRVYRNGEPVAIEAEKQRRLLGLLALRPGRVATLDGIAAVLWDDSAPRSWQSLIHTYVARLRNALGSETAILTARGGYALHVDDEHMDVVRFSRAFDDALRCRRTGDLEGMAQRLRQALDLWRGQVLDGLADRLRPHQAAIDELTHDRLRAALAFADAVMALGRPGQAVGVLEGLAREQPLHEGVHARLILALAGDGRQAAASTTYAHIHERLAEMGLEPGWELREARIRVLPQDMPGCGVAVPLALAESPAEAASFVGRTAEGDELCELLAHGGVATITGAAGVGKTALAIHVGHRVARDFPDGQLYLNLRGAVPGRAPLTAGEALGALLRSLKVSDSAIPVTDDEAARRFRSLVAGKRMLLVLDDARDAAQVRPLLPGGAGCGVLVTSRRTLTALDSAAHRELDVLSEGEAVNVLVRLVGAGRVEADPRAAADLVLLCGRLPLAVRIVAARLAARPAWPLRGLADKLAAEHSRLNVLRVDDLEVRASFLCSYRDLDAEAAAMFRSLALLDGPDVSLEVAASLADLDTDTAGTLLEVLLDRHLVEAHAADRFRMHDLLRLFALERGADDDRPPARKESVLRALHLYLATARAASELAGLGQPWRQEVGPATRGVRRLSLKSNADVNTWINTDSANLIAAVGQAGRMGEHELAVALATALSFSFYDQGRWRDLLSLGEIALDAALRSEDGRLEAYARTDLAWAQHRLGLLDAAGQHLTRALSLIGEHDLDHLKPHALVGLAGVHQRVGRLDEAIACFRLALALNREQDDPVGEAFNLTNLGAAYTQLGRLDDAIETLTRAVVLAEEHGTRARVCAVGDLAEAHRLAGDARQAAAHFEKAITLSRREGLVNTYAEAESHWRLGLALRDLGRQQEAEVNWRKSADILRQLGLTPIDSTPPGGHA